jgi:putative transposon-encoded protein
MKVKIKKTDYSVDADEIIEQEIKTFGKYSGHIVVPGKWVGRTAVIIIKGLVKRWTGGYLKKGYVPLSKKELRKIEDKELEKM